MSAASQIKSGGKGSSIKCVKVKESCVASVLCLLSKMNGYINSKKVPKGRGSVGFAFLHR